jgi:hypothetical protein
MNDDASRRPAEPEAAPSADGFPGFVSRFGLVPVVFLQRAGDGWLEWEVVEVDARDVPGALHASCLIFTRPDCVRRVWDYPSDWRSFDDAGLSALSWHR